MAKARARVRNEFVIKDLVVSLPRAHGGGGGTFLPVDDGTPLPWWISPIAAVLDKGDVLQTVGATITEVLKSGGDVAGIVNAFEGDPDDSPAIRHAIRDVGRAVVAAAAFTAIGGTVGYPDPDCSGDSMATIPPTLTPIVHTGIEMHRVTELPRLRAQLAIAVETLDRAAAALEPRGSEADMVAKQLEGALKAVRR